MKLTPFADRARTLLVALGLALVASFGASNAYAADKLAPGQLDPKALAQGMTDAPMVIAAAKLNCEPVAGYLAGPTESLAADGKTKVKGNIYEVACKAGPGFIVTKITDSEAHDPFTCTSLAKIKEAHPESIVCVLPENIPHYKWLGPVVQPYLPGCEVTNARLIGSSTAEPLIDRYEVQCKSGPGGLIDYAQLAATAKTDFKSCLIEADSSSACKFTTKEQIVASMKSIAAQADADCQVSDVRFVGVTSTQDGFFYEFGCSNKAGFMVRTANDGTFNRIINCAAAIPLGGCKFTDTAGAVADANTIYTNQLKAADYNCTVTDFDLKGTQESTKRDFLEFKCSERPWGLIGFIPQPGSTAKVKVDDCFNDQTRKAPYCTFVTPAQMMAQWDKLINVAKPGKDCKVKDVRYIGESEGEEGGIVAELACVNKRGYIAVMSADRQSIVVATACRIAKAHKDPEQCTIEGNGSYTSDDD